MAFIVCLTAYLLGSIPFGLLLTKAVGLGDVRQIGSGNIGATNVLRTGNKKLALLTLLLDGLKGYVAVALALHLMAHSSFTYRTANGQSHMDYNAGAMAYIVAFRIVPIVAVLGHIFPVWLRFKGGKGVATAFGAVLALSPAIGGIGLAAWLCVFMLTRISSLSALTAMVVMPVSAALSHSGDTAALLVISLLVIWRHKDNIRRLLAGTEPRFGKKS